MLRVKGFEAPKYPTFNDMKDGDIAVIVESALRSNIGRVIQRRQDGKNDVIFEVGGPRGCCWRAGDGGYDGFTQIRILDKGTEFILE